MDILQHLNGFRGVLAILVLAQHATKYLKIRGDYLMTLDLGMYLIFNSFLLYLIKTKNLKKDIFNKSKILSLKSILSLYLQYF